MAEWIIVGLFNVVRRYWLTLTLFAVLVSTITYSLDAANWVKNDQGLVSMFLAGVALGWLLSTSRFRGWLVAGYAVLMGFLLSLNSVGQVTTFPGRVFGTPFWTLVDQLNLNAFTFYLRVSGWIEVLKSGESLKDTGLFEILLGYILLLSGVWMMWWLVRKRKMLPGLLPVGYLFAMNLHLARQSLGYFMMFLLAAILLIARTNYNHQNEEWQRRRVDYPDQLGLEWGASAVFLALVIVMMARTLPLVATREGWQAIAEWTAKARERTNKTTDRLFGGINPPPPDPSLEPRAVVDTPNLNEIGSPYSQGNQTVMWVRISDPPPIPPEIGMNVPVTVNPTRIHYWRSGIFGVYTGRGWEPISGGDTLDMPATLPEAPPPGRYYLRQSYQIMAVHNSELFSTNDPLQAGSPVSLVSAGPADTRLLRGAVDTYEVISAATDVTANRLDSTGTEYPAEVNAVYLQIPDGLPERVHALSARVSAAGRTPYQKAILIQEYLRANYTYDLGARPAPAGRDVVDYFLFDTKHGFCSHYATTMAVMLRTVGVPARVVTGYAMGEWNQAEMAYRVPESNAHAWVEVYFPGYGWAEFEPTASRNPFVYREEAPVMDSTAVAQVSSKVMVPPEAVTVGFTLVGALLLLLLPFVLVRLFGVLRLGPTVRPDVLYRQVRRALGWAGLSASPSLTPDEYLVVCREPLARYETLEKALHQVTEVYREQVYSPHPPDTRRIRRASLTWGQSTRDWLALFARSVWQRVQSRLPGR